MNTEMTVEQIASVTHDANASYCRSIGDNSQPTWAEAPDWQRKSAIKGVIFVRDNPGATPKASHESWLDEKCRDGWQYGPTKDPGKKLHPCFVPYDALPIEQRRKDALFQAVVRECLAK